MMFPSRAVQPLLTQAEVGDVVIQLPNMPPTDQLVTLGRDSAAAPPVDFSMVVGGQTMASMRLTEGLQLRDFVFKPAGVDWEFVASVFGSTRVVAQLWPLVAGAQDEGNAMPFATRFEILPAAVFEAFSPDGSGLPPEGKHLLQLFSHHALAVRFLHVTVLPVVTPLIEWVQTGFNPHFTYLHSPDLQLEVKADPGSEDPFASVIGIWSEHL